MPGTGPEKLPIPMLCSQMPNILIAKASCTANILENDLGTDLGIRVYIYIHIYIYL